MSHNDTYPFTPNFLGSEITHRARVRPASRRAALRVRRSPRVPPARGTRTTPTARRFTGAASAERSSAWTRPAAPSFGSSTSGRSPLSRSISTTTPNST